MRSIHKYIISCFLLGWFSIPVIAEDIVAIKADRVDTVTSGIIENGIIVIRNGKISAIGADVEIPENAKIMDVHDKTVFPGLINPSSRIGLSSPPGGGPSSNPHYRVADELYPFQDAYDRILQAGFTTLGLIPWGNGITGQGAIVRPAGETPEEMLVAESGFLMINFQANDRAKKVIKDALDAAKKQEKSIDPKVQPLVMALKGEIPTYVRCYYPSEVLHLLKLLKPYDKMKVVLIPGFEPFHVAKQLAEKKIPVILPARINFEQFTRDRINIPGMLAHADVKIACQPESDSVQGHEDFLRAMAQLVQCGLDREIARKSITIHSAEMLGIDYRLGSLEVGKDANLLILDGDPLDVGTKIHQVMIEGKIVYQAP
jgi:hypothetical protein